MASPLRSYWLAVNYSMGPYRLLSNFGLALLEHWPVRYFQINNLVGTPEGAD